MSMFKTAMATAAALGLVVSGAASAEPIRSAHSLPGVATKAARTTAPRTRESAQHTEERYLGGGEWYIAAFAATGAFLGGYYAFRDDKPASPGS
jgi:hypothetical protein